VAAAEGFYELEGVPLVHPEELFEQKSLRVLPAACFIKK
jgi:hypothetical protein